MKKLVSILFISLSQIFFYSCGGPENGDELADGVGSNEHRIFVSSFTTKGSMSGGSGATGILKADDLCDLYAKNAGLNRKYVAILSDDDTNISTKLIISGAIYVIDSNGEKNKIASNASELWNANVDDPLANLIDHDETGKYLGSTSGDIEVWTGSVQGGTNSSDNCSNWTDDTTEIGTYGVFNEKSDLWIDSSTSTCSDSKRLYCISQ